MATLATVWKANIKVCFVPQPLFGRRSNKLSRRCSSHVQAICLNPPWNNLLPSICLCFFGQSSSLWTPNRWSTTPVITALMFVWVAPHLWCVASSGFRRPHKLGHYTMRPSGIRMPVFGWAKMWSGKPSRIMPNGYPSCWGHRPLSSSVDPVVVIACCWVVMCILPCSMALWRLQMAHIKGSDNYRLAPGDEANRAAIQATLHQPPEQPARPVRAAPAQRAPLAAPTPVQHVNTTTTTTTTNNNKKHETRGFVTGDRPRCACPRVGGQGMKGGWQIGPWCWRRSRWQGGTDRVSEGREVGGQVSPLSAAWGRFRGGRLRAKRFWMAPKVEVAEGGGYEAEDEPTLLHVPWQPKPPTSP